MWSREAPRFVTEQFVWRGYLDGSRFMVIICAAELLVFGPFEDGHEGQFVTCSAILISGVPGANRLLCTRETDPIRERLKYACGHGRCVSRSVDALEVDVRRDRNCLVATRDGLVDD